MISQNFLNDVAEYTEGKISVVVLNETHEIQSFVSKTVSDGTVQLEYIIPAGVVDVVTLIQLKDEQGNVISSNTVYVPITADTLISHPIQIKEVSYDVQSENGLGL